MTTLEQRASTCQVSLTECFASWQAELLLLDFCSTSWKLEFESFEGKPGL
jgi:hypothetical protein